MLEKCYFISTFIHVGLFGCCLSRVTWKMEIKKSQNPPPTQPPNPQAVFKWEHTTRTYRKERRLSILLAVEVEMPELA